LSHLMLKMMLLKTQKMQTDFYVGPFRIMFLPLLFPINLYHLCIGPRRTKKLYMVISNPHWTILGLVLCTVMLSTYLFISGNH